VGVPGNHQLTTASTDWLRAVEGGVEVLVVAAPRASKSRVVGPHGDRLKVQLAAPPVDGEANAELVALFRELFSLGRQAVELVDGEKSKRKRVRLLGVSLAQALDALAPVTDTRPA
jgi:uncharacterized protein